MNFLTKLRIFSRKRLAECRLSIKFLSGGFGEDVFEDALYTVQPQRESVHFTETKFENDSFYSLDPSRQKFFVVAISQAEKL